MSEETINESYLSTSVATAALGVSFQAQQSSYQALMGANAARLAASTAERNSSAALSKAGETQQELDFLRAQLLEASREQTKLLKEIHGEIVGLRDDRRKERLIDETRENFEIDFGSDWKLAKRHLKQWIRGADDTWKREVALRWAVQEKISSVRHHWLFAALIYRSVVYLGKNELLDQAEALLVETSSAGMDGNIHIILHWLETYFYNSSKPLEIGKVLVENWKELGDGFQNYLPRRRFMRQLLEDASLGRFGNQAQEMAHQAICEEWENNWPRLRQDWACTTQHKDFSSISLADWTVFGKLTGALSLSAQVDKLYGSEPGSSVPFFLQNLNLNEGQRASFASAFGALLAEIKLENIEKNKLVLKQAPKENYFTFDAGATLDALIATQYGPVGEFDAQYQASLRLLGMEVLYENHNDAEKAAEALIAISKPIEYVDTFAPLLGADDPVFNSQITSEFQGGDVDSIKNTCVFAANILFDKYESDLVCILRLPLNPTSMAASPDFYFYKGQFSELGLLSFSNVQELTKAIEHQGALHLEDRMVQIRNEKDAVLKSESQAFSGQRMVRTIRSIIGCSLFFGIPFVAGPYLNDNRIAQAPVMAFWVTMIGLFFFTIYNFGMARRASAEIRDVKKRIFPDGWYEKEAEGVRKEISHAKAAMNSVGKLLEIPYIGKLRSLFRG